MPSGGCFCNKIRVSYTGDAVAHALCHCMDCRKISGGLFSNNFIVPEDKFKVESGTTKTITKVADAGDKITNHFCPDCGTTLFRDADSMPGLLILKMGMMDDPEWPNQHVPSTELFSGNRVNWLHPLPGAKQKDAM